MKTILVLCLFIAAVYSRPDTYSTRYDNFDVETLVENTRLLESFGKCFLSSGPCNPEAKEFKKTIPEALRSGCGKCSPRQRHLVRIVVKAFQMKTPDIWKQLIKKEDPTGQYKDISIRFLNASD